MRLVTYIFLFLISGFCLAQNSSSSEKELLIFKVEKHRLSSSSINIVPAQIDGAATCQMSLNHLMSNYGLISVLTDQEKTNAGALLRYPVKSYSMIISEKGHLTKFNFTSCPPGEAIKKLQSAKAGTTISFETVVVRKPDGKFTELKGSFKAVKQ